MTFSVDADLLEDLGWSHDGDIWTHPITRGKFDLLTALEVTRRAFTGYTGNQDADWEPSESDIAWQKQLVQGLEHGAVWQTSEGKFRIYKDDKQALLLVGDPNKGLIRQILMVFKKLGWEVTVAKKD